MKAEINGIKLEGTPQEIAEVIKLAGLVKEVQATIPYVPIPTYPTYPGTPWQPSPWWGINPNLTQMEPTMPFKPRLWCAPNTAAPLRDYSVWTSGSGASATAITWTNSHHDGPDNAGAPVPS